MFASEGCAACHTPPSIHEQQTHARRRIHPAEGCASDIERHAAISRDRSRVGVGNAKRNRLLQSSLPQRRVVSLDIFLHYGSVASLKEMFIRTA